MLCISLRQLDKLDENVILVHFLKLSGKDREIMNTIKDLIMQCKPHYDNVRLPESSYALETVGTMNTRSSHQIHTSVIAIHFSRMCVYVVGYACVCKCVYMHTCDHVYVEARVSFISNTVDVIFETRSHIDLEPIRLDWMAREA